ncbi:FAD dependent oxidoreductase superfamily [Peziza echinospora]|nr:FAD dependent oxidoreductase superfamily [Peziza echinospora]
MPTSKNPLVIIGGGIVGTSTAYFLSLLHPTREIHIIEAASALFPSGSSRGAGFIAKDWFSSSVADLGALSFSVHKELAEKHGGREKWGYAGSIGVSLITPGIVAELHSSKEDERWESWLFQGTSRAEAAVTPAPSEPSVALEGTAAADMPPWLQLSGHPQVEVISRPDSTSQIHPLKFCNFLMGECIARGVHLHLNTTATAVLVSPVTGALAGIQTSGGLNLPCSQVLISSGVWTPRVIHTLFPNANPALPVLKVTSLAGHSIVYQRKTPPTAAEAASENPPCHAIFTTDEDEHFSPEIFSRLPTNDIYLAGLNSPNIPVPDLATEDAHPPLDHPAIVRLHKVGERMLRPENLEIVKTGCCHRPVLPDGKPMMGRIPDEQLGLASSTSRSSPSSSPSPGGLPGVYTCVGHGSWGVALGPGSGLVMAEILEGRKTSADVSLLSVEHQIEQLGLLI